MKELYFSPLSSSLPFSVGAVLYLVKVKINYFNETIQNTLSILIPNIILVMIFVFTSMTINPQESFQDFKISYYLSIIYISIIIMFLSKIKYSDNMIANIDSILGSTSYPLYLLHWPIFSFLNSLFWRLSIPNHTIILIASTCFVIIMICILLLNPLEYIIKRKLDLIISEK